MTLNAAIFDLDGTLADTLADIGGAMNFVLGELGLPEHPLAVYRAFVGEGVAKLAARALPPDRAELHERAVAAFRARYAEHLLDATAPYPGIPEALAALAARGLPLAVLSNKPDAPTRRIVEALFPDVPFAVVAGERPPTPRKPDPTAALELAAALGVAPARCAFVGDTRVDMETAVAAGMFPVGVLWGFRDRDELLAAGARALAATPAELPAILV